MTYTIHDLNMALETYQRLDDQLTDLEDLGSAISAKDYAKLARQAGEAQDRYIKIRDCMAPQQVAYAARHDGWTLGLIN